MVDPSSNRGHRLSREISDSRSQPWYVPLLRWFDNEAGQWPDDGSQRRVDWLRTLPFVCLHLACLTVFWVGISPVAVGVALGLYLLRMFAITGFYHRYFSHKTFKTHRWVESLFGFIGAAVMTFLLVRVSGVALLEKSLRKRKPEYEDYVRRTSAFVPRPPKAN